MGTFYAVLPQCLLTSFGFTHIHKGMNLSKLKKMTFVLLLFLQLVLPLQAKVISVSPDCVNRMKYASSGDTILLQDGRYKAPVMLCGLKGSTEHPIVIKVMHEGKVRFDGTDYLNGDWKEVTPESEEGKLIQKGQWKRIKNKVYCQKLDAPIYALVYRGRLMSDARWPNSNWDDPWRLDRYMVLRRADVQSQKGELYDGLATENALQESSTWLHYDRAQCKNRDEMLADLDISFTDAVVVMSHTWGSWATRVTHHEAGKNNFSYDTSFKGSGAIQKEANSFLNHRIGWNNSQSQFALSSHGGLQFFLMGLPALDAPEEWWYDQTSNLLFFVSPDNRAPQKNEVEGKRRDYQLKFTDCEYVYCDGIAFYGGTISLKDCFNCRIDNCDFRFSSSQKFSVGNFDRPATTLIENEFLKRNFGNSMQNCSFSYLDGNAMEVNSVGFVMDNVLVYRTQQTTLGGDSYAIYLKNPALVRRVTIDDVGASEGICGGMFPAIFELNSISRLGGLQYDGGAIQTLPRVSTIYRYNWSYNHPKCAYRFDIASYPDKANAFGEMSYNLAWNTVGAFVLKGDDYLVHNNLAIGESGFLLYNTMKWASKNERTLVANNIVPKITAGGYDWKTPGIRKNIKTGVHEPVEDYWLKETPVSPDCPTYVGKVVKTFAQTAHVKGVRPSPILSTIKNNYFKNPRRVLRDPDNWDFRLKDSVALIQAGYKVNSLDAPWKTQSITGSSEWNGNPSIGPYEPNENYYWIPGYQYREASTPIPVDGTQTAKLDCDLMWLEGYKAEQHIVYFGTTHQAVSDATESSEAMIATVPAHHNIVSLSEHGVALKPRTTYYWRVDACIKGKVVKGKVWNFTTANAYGNII